MRSPPPARNQLRISCLYDLWRQDFILSGKCKLKTRTHMGKLAPTSLCGDEISSCRGSASWKLAPTWENSHPPLFVATRFHLVGEVQVENSHPQGMGKLAPTSLVATRFYLVGEVQVGKLAPTWDGKNCSPPLLWRQDFYQVIVSGKCKLENSHPHWMKILSRQETRCPCVATRDAGR